MAADIILSFLFPSSIHQPRIGQLLPLSSYTQAEQSNVCAVSASKPAPREKGVSLSVNSRMGDATTLIERQQRDACFVCHLKRAVTS